VVVVGEGRGEGRAEGDGGRELGPGHVGHVEKAQLQPREAAAAVAGHAKAEEVGAVHDVEVLGDAVHLELLRAERDQGQEMECRNTHELASPVHLELLGRRATREYRVRGIRDGRKRWGERAGADGTSIWKERVINGL
jgi:hypothetical protein